MVFGIWGGLADVIAMCLCVAMYVLLLADVIAMLLYDFLIDGDVITIRLVL